MMSDDASTWARLKHGDSQCSYSRRQLCPMPWVLETPLHKCTSAVMPAGGPIALLSGSGDAPSTQMRIYSGAGELLCSWTWDVGHVLVLGWTADVELVSVLEGGRVMLWNVRGARTAHFALGDLIDHAEILLCEVYSGGVPRQRFSPDHFRALVTR